MGGDDFNKTGSVPSLRDKISNSAQELENRLRKTVDQIFESGLETAVIECVEKGARKGRWNSKIKRRETINNIQYERLCSGIIDMLDQNGVSAKIGHARGCTWCETIGDADCCYRNWESIMVVHFEIDAGQ